MRVLVTGALGFIGTALLPALEAAGYGVRGLGRAAGPLADWRSADLTSPASLAGVCADCDAVIHLAGVAHTRASGADHRAVTVEGTRALLAEARAAGVAQFLFVSSIKAECARDEYADSRRAAEELMRKAGLPSCMIVRPALVYGPGVRGNLKRLLQLADHPWPLPIPRGLARRSLVHRDDLVRVLVALLSGHAHTATYTVTDGMPYTMREIYDVMRVGCGRRVGRYALPAGALTALARFGDGVTHWTRRPCPWDTSALAPLLEACVSTDDGVWGAIGLTPRYSLAQSVAGMVEALRVGGGAR